MQEKTFFVKNFAYVHQFGLVLVPYRIHSRNLLHIGQGGSYHVLDRYPMD